MLWVSTALYITVHFFTNDINSTDDLTEISGRLSYYSFDKIRHRKGLTYYYDYSIKLENYQSMFKIKESHISEFNKVDFETHVRRGDWVILTIPNSDVDELNFKAEINITSIKVGSLTYLEAKRVIAKGKNPIQLLYALGFLILSFLVFKYWHS